MVSDNAGHWEKAWAGRDPATTSWFQAVPAQSLALISASGVAPSDPIIDVGGGESTLTLHLLERGYRDLTVLDIAPSALDALDAALVTAQGHHSVAMVATDVLMWRPGRAYGLWHDRAVNHFLTNPADRAAYVAIAATAVRSGGHLVLASFALDGPEQCSALPVHRSDAEILAAEFADAFAVVSIHREAHETPWGAAQSFHYLLLQRR